MRGLGAKAAQEFHSKKASDVEILVSEKINDKELLGIFANSFALSNYEFTHKTAPPTNEEEDKKAMEDADYDPRTKKIYKKFDSVSIKSESTDVYSDSDVKFWLVSADATAYARDLANTRGSVADPDYME